MNVRIYLGMALLVSMLALAGCSTPTTAPTALPESTPSELSQPTQEIAKTTSGPLEEGVTRYQIVPNESEVMYEVGETFINQDNRFQTAVGVTTQIEGEITIDHQNPQNSTIGVIRVDISKFTSDSSRRDNVIRNDWLESTRFPIAEFTPTSIEGLPAEGVEGQLYDLTITGDLKVKEVTRQVTFKATISLSGDELTGSADATILMSDFGVGPISIAGILNTEDEAHIIFNFVARP